MTIPDSGDCRHQSPVFFGYDLVKKPRSRAGALPEDEVPRREDFIAHGKGKPCPVCLVGKPGTTMHPCSIPGTGYIFLLLTSLYLGYIFPPCRGPLL